MRKYTIKGRLSDVIALISLLSVDEGTFRTITKLNIALRGEPRSAVNWEAIAQMHPEFFRFNEDRTTIALLIRSYFPVLDAQGKRKPLEVSETQKLIDTAISLHDKEIALYQKNSYLYSFLGSLIVSLIAVSGTIFSTVYTNKKNSDVSVKMDTVIDKIQRIERKIK